MAHPFRHAILPALFVLVASVLLPACDGGDSSTTPAPAPSPAPAPPPPPPPPPEPAQIAGDWILVSESGRHAVETLVPQRVYGLALAHEDLNDHYVLPGRRSHVLTLHRVRTPLRGGYRASPEVRPFLAPAVFF